MLSDNHVRDICKIGQKQNCCRYLLCGANGFECGKVNEFKSIIDDNVKNMIAKSDNCKGVI